MFKTYRCGTEHEVRDVTSYTLRLIPQELQVDIGLSRGSKDLNPREIDRKCSYSMLSRHQETMNNHVSTMTGVMTNRVHGNKEKGSAELRHKKMATLEVMIRMRSAVTGNYEALSLFIEKEIRRTMDELDQY